MLTLIENLQRQMKRYNRKRGSAMLMVLMTMAVIIVVGTSMLYITLSSFSISMSDTNKEKAYNAAMTVSENVKNNFESLIAVYQGKVLGSETQSTYLSFVSSENFENKDEIVDYTKINGSKVRVKMSNVGTSTGVLDKVLVDVEASYRSQSSLVSFTIDRTATTTSKTLEDTYGNAFVVTSNLGGMEKSSDLVFKRIEGDVSIDCYDKTYNEDTGEVLTSKMVTRFFNPTVLEGVTGSIFANGDLIVGGINNVIKIRGNIYCDGNLYLRGVDLGVNLPALYKKGYNTKYLHYWTMTNSSFMGFAILGTNSLTERTNKGQVGEAMYEKKADGTFVPIQAYDEISHYTLADLDISTFWTKEYTSNTAFTWKQITLDFSKGPQEQYYGASLYYPVTGADGKIVDVNTYNTTGNEQYILQYPEGGNVYCSGDIIIDSYNAGNVFSMTVNEKEYDYYDLSYSSTTPAINQSYVRGDVFCLGRMICAPVTLFTDGTTASHSDLFNAFYTGYVTGSDVSSTGLYGNASTFKSLITNLWNSVANTGFGYDNIFVSNRFYTDDQDKAYTSGEKQLTVRNDQTLNGHGGNQSDYYQAAYDQFKSQALAQKNQGETSSAYLRLRSAFKNAIVANGSLYTGSFVSDIKGGAVPSTSNILRPLKFASSSNIYIYNTPERKVNEGNANNFEVNNAANPEKWQKESVLYGMTYTSALTLKMMDISVNNVFVNGNVESISSKIGGYVQTSKLTANKISTTGLVSAEFQAASVTDIIEGAVGSTSQVAKDYWGIENGDGIVSGEIDLSFSIDDGAAIVLRVREEFTEFLNFDKKWNGVKYHWEFVNRSLSSAKYFLDVYITGHEGGIDLKIYGTDGKKTIITTFGVKDSGVDGYQVISNSKESILSALKGNSGITSNSSQAEIERMADVISKTGIKKSGDKWTIFANLNITDPYCLIFDYLNTASLVENHYGYIYSTDPSKYDLGGLFSDGEITNNRVYYHNLSAIDEETAEDEWVDSSGNEIGSEVGKISFVLNYSSIQADFGEKKMVTLYSNKKTGHDSIVSSNKVTSADHYAYKSLEENATNSPAIGEFGVTTPYTNKLYAMYLRTTNINYNNITRYANVEDIFNEIKNDTFSAVSVTKLKTLTEEKMREKINKGEISVTEYDNFEIISGNDSKENADNPLYDIKMVGLSQATVTENGTTKNISSYSADSGFFDSLSTVTGKTIGDFFDPLHVFGDGYHSYSQAMSYTKSKAFNNYTYFLYNDTSSKDDNVRVMQFKNTKSAGVKWTAEPGLASDPMYTESLTNYRTQVNYSIDSDVYFNLGGEFGGYDTETQGPVVFGASFDDSIGDSLANVTKTVRMQINVDTSQHDVHIYLNAPEYNNTSAKWRHGLKFNKVTVQVTGKNNVYFILVGDTSINLNAYTTEANINGGVFDKDYDTSDAMTGSHFYSTTWDVYKTSFVLGTEDDNKYTTNLKVGATYVRTDKVGTMFIIGTQENEVAVGRGGFINGFVYLPNGTYKTESKGFLDILPNASAANASATIVAENVQILGSNIGNLIYSAFDVTATGGAANINIDDKLFKTETTTTYSWTFSGFYYA